MTESPQNTNEEKNLIRLLLTQYQLPVAIIGLLGTFLGLVIPQLSDWIKILYLKNHGVTLTDPSQLQTAIEQNEAWTRNMSCFDVDSITNVRWFDASLISLAPIVCPITKDILIQVKYKDNSIKPFMRWITIEEQKAVSQDQSLGTIMLGIEATYANSYSPNIFHGSGGYIDKSLIASESFSVITQQRTSSTTITRQTRSTSGNCYTEVINTFTGTILKTPKGICPLVYIQIARDNQRTKSEALQSALNNGGFAAPGIENVGDNIGPRPKIPSKMQIRIAKKDEAYLPKIFQIVNSQALPNPEVIWLADTVNAIEIWFGSSN